MRMSEKEGLALELFDAGDDLVELFGELSAALRLSGDGLFELFALFDEGVEFGLIGVKGDG